MSMAATGSAAGDAGHHFQAIYREHHGWLRQWLSRRLGNDTLALDLAQDAFLRLLNARCPIEAIHTPRAYLTTVAHGLVVNHWRRSAVERAYLDAIAARGEALAPSPEDAQLALESLHEIVAMLDRLPAQVRRAFLLSQLDGWTYPRIAEHLGISVNMVQKAMGRALRACYGIVYG